MLNEFILLTWQNNSNKHCPTQQSVQSIAKKMGNKESRNKVQPKRIVDKSELTNEDSTEVVPKHTCPDLVVNETTSLYEACKHGYFDVVCLILEKEADVDVNFQDKNGWSSLMFASKGGHTSIVRNLLKHDICLDLQDKNGNTALIIACREGKGDIIELLLQNGANVNQSDGEGATALHTACLKGDLKSVKLLMVYNPDVSLLTISKESPLDIAKKEKNVKIMKIMMENEANSNSTKKDNKSVACTSRSPDEIAAEVRISPKLLDEPCSQDSLRKIAWFLPKWIEYAGPLGLTPQDIDAIHKMDSQGMASRLLLSFWHKKQQHTPQCHYRVLVQTSCTLGYEDVAKSICELLRESPGSRWFTFSQPVCQYLTDDLVLLPHETIGRGAFGIVFKGKYKEKPCAIKVLRDVGDEVQLSLPLASHTETHFTKRFKDECKFLEKLKHNNVVRHLATEEYPNENRHLVLVLELMDCNLRQFFTTQSTRRLPIKTQRKLCHDIASALRYLHYRKIVHRDLCSDNILLNHIKEDIPIAKVCDFGMSKVFDNQLKSISLVAIGRKGYMPPEASNTSTTKIHPSFDIFSFGAIIIQIVRHLPTIESSKQRTVEFNKIRTNYPLRHAIEKCLRPDKKDRPSAVEIRNELER